MSVDLVLNPGSAQYSSDRLVDPDAVAFHQRQPGYRATPLLAIPSLAERTGVRSVHVKVEADRFGLPAFKVLGASWAVHRALAERADVRVLVAATDGNHGRAVAHVARTRGLEARIYVPRGTTARRIAAIRDQGATVLEWAGSYDDAVLQAARSITAKELLVSDTAADPDDRMAGWVIDGYSTLFAEIASQQPDGFTAVLVGMGVGALATATIRYAKSLLVPAHVIGVEPDTAACVLQSLRQGRPASVPGPHPSIMVGLNCGAPSAVAWPTLAAGLDAACTVTDVQAKAAVDALAGAGLAVGATGAASAAGLLALAEDGLLPRVLPEPATSDVLLLVTEGATD